MMPACEPPGVCLVAAYPETEFIELAAFAVFYRTPGEMSSVTSVRRRPIG